MKGIGGIETENWYVWYERGEKEREERRGIEARNARIRW